MADFRKLIPALAIAALGVVGASSANAQTGSLPGQAFTCTANAGNPAQVRAEGITELVGDIVLNCTGGVPTAAGTAVPQVNITVALNTNVTSRILETANNTTEALLAIDDPRSDQTATSGLTGASQGNQVLCNAINTAACSLVGVGAINPGGLGIVYNPGNGGANNGATNVVRNFYPGRLTAVNQLTWFGIPIDPPGTNTRVIRMSNIRANASQLGVSSTLIPTQIVAFIQTSGQSLFQINNPTVTVGFVNPGLIVSFRNAANSGALGTNGSTFLQCQSLNSALAGSSSTGTASTGSFVVRFQEGFASAFKRRNFVPGVGILGNNAGINTQADTSPAPQPQQFFDRQYNTETGFYQPAFGSAGAPSGSSGVGNIANAGLADHGTRFIIRVTNLQAGVQLFATIYELGPITGAGTTGAGTSTTSRVRLVTTDQNGAGAFAAASATSTAGSGNQSGTTLVSGLGIAPFSGSGTTQYAVYEVMFADPLALDTIDVGITAAYTSNTTNNIPALGTSSVTANFAPLSTVTTASTSAPIPRFVDNPRNVNALTINACATNLLFPFVTNQAGFDTGLAISNTSQDPFGTPTQAGTCTLNFYGTTVGGGTAPGPFTSTTVNAGSQLLYVLSSGGNLGLTTSAAGFQGYIIAQCRFQYGHGFAFVTDGPIGTARVAEGYLALVMDDLLGDRTVRRNGGVTVSEPLNH